MINTKTLERRLNHLTPWFIFSVALILSVTALAKVISAHGSSKILDVPDSLLSISNRRLLLVAAILEAFVLGCLAFVRNATWKLALVTWLTLVFGAYRAGTLLAGGHAPCPCLGTLTDRLHVSSVLVDKLMFGILLYMGVGSLTLLIKQKLRQKVKTDILT